MEIKIFKITDDERKKMKIPDAPARVNGWSVWECEPSEFGWHYDNEETAYVYAGKVRVKTGQGEVHIGAGDFVLFPKGLSCYWVVEEKISKVYRF